MQQEIKKINMFDNIGRPSSSMYQKHEISLQCSNWTYMHATSVPQSCNLRPASHTRKNPQANKSFLSLPSVGYESSTKQDYNTTNWIKIIQVHWSGSPEVKNISNCYLVSKMGQIKKAKTNNHTNLN